MVQATQKSKVSNGCRNRTTQCIVAEFSKSHELIHWSNISNIDFNYRENKSCRFPMDSGRDPDILLLLRSLKQI